MNIVEIDVRFFQDGFDARFGGGSFNQEEDALNTGEMANNFSEGPGNGGEFAGPIGQFMRPAKESAFVGRKFGGHPVIQGLRGGAIPRFRHSSQKKQEFNTDNSQGRNIRRKNKLIAEPTIEDWLIGVDSTVAEEGPVTACLFAL